MTNSPDRLAAIAAAFRAYLVDFDSANAAVDATVPRCVNHPDTKAVFVRGIQRTPLCEACYDEAEDLR